MQEANQQTVLGDFDNVRFEHFGIESRFRTEGGEFFVTTPDSDGEPTRSTRSTIRSAIFRYSNT